MELSDSATVKSMVTIPQDGHVLISMVAAGFNPSTKTMVDIDDDYVFISQADDIVLAINIDDKMFIDAIKNAKVLHITEIDEFSITYFINIVMNDKEFRA